MVRFVVTCNAVFTLWTYRFVAGVHVRRAAALRSLACRFVDDSTAVRGLGGGALVMTSTVTMKTKNTDDNNVGP